MIPITSFKFNIALVSIAGAVLVLAFAPFSYWWLTLVSPTILFFSNIYGSSSPKQSFVLGFVFGVFFFGFGVPWTYNSIHEYGHAPAILSAFLAGLLVLILAVFPGLVCYLFKRLTKNENCLNIIQILNFSCLWVLFEWIRSWIFTGFPWLLLGHVHHSNPIQAVLPVFGSYGASFLSVLLPGMLLIIFFANLRQKLFSLVALLFISSVLFFSNYIEWTKEIDEPLNVAIIQGNIPQEMKWDTKMHPYIMQKYLALSNKHLDADLIIWPETAIPTYYRMVEDNIVNELQTISNENNVDFLVGLFLYEDKTNKVFNSVMALGKNIEFYQKQHLVPFGEYIPFRGLIFFLEKYIKLPMADISPGSGRPLVSLNGFQAGASICYEAVYGNEIIRAMPDAMFLINVSNDAWFGDSNAPHQHLEITRSRSIETGRYLLRATNTGISAIISPDGTILNKSLQFNEDVVRANISPRTGSTPYVYWGNWGIITLILSILFIILYLQRSR